MRCKGLLGALRASLTRVGGPLVLLEISSACTPLEPPTDFFGADAGATRALSELNRGAGADSGLTRPSPIAGCLPVAERPPFVVGEPDQPFELSEDADWSCRANYVLATPLVVRPGVTLSVGPDTRVSSARGAFVLIARGARLVAEGSREAPIIFTSARPPGRRAPADWRGLLMAGNARSHLTNATLPHTLSAPHAAYGGGPNGALEHDCGSLRYVRIEFAGGNTDEEALPVAALSLAGCGSATQVDYVQVHRATDGIGLFGGTARLKHVVVSNNGLGDAIEWTGGYTGEMQYVVAQSAGAAAAFKGSNSDTDPSLVPVSHPVIFNATAVGVRPTLPSGSHLGLLLQLGSAATLKNSIVTNFEDGGVELRSAQTIGAVSTNDISHVQFHDNGADGTTHLTAAAAGLDSDSLRERDPGLTGAKRRERPDFRPSDDSVRADISVTPAGFDPAATFRGALPFQGDDWTLDWTDYPVD